MQELKSQLNIFAIVFIILGIIGFSSLSYFITSNSLNADYPQIAGIILGGVFGLFAVFALIVLLRIDVITITSTHITIKSIFGNKKRSFQRNEINSYIDLKDASVKSNSIKFSSLVLFHSKGKYKIESSAYSNYSVIRKELIRGKSKNKNYLKVRKKKFDKIGATFLLIFGLVVIIFGFKLLFFPKESINSNSLTEVKGSIINKVEITKGSKGKRSISIILKEYPKFKFDISGTAFKATNKTEYLSNVSIGNTLHLGILTNSYNKKISKHLNLTFWDKSINYHFIQVYELKDKERTYLSIQDYNKKAKESAIWNWLIVLFGLYLLWEAFKLNLHN